MESPTKDIHAVIHNLTQGNPYNQKRTLDAYFTPDVSFDHPFCRVPSFSRWQVPIIGELNSRWVLWMIYRWYKWLSPTIQYKINSIAYDPVRQWLYVEVFQIFSIWFIPFFSSPVSLIVLLKLRVNPVNGRYYIQAQSDHYLTREWIKFLVPKGDRLVDLAQYFVSATCVVYVIFLSCIAWAWQNMTRHFLRVTKKV